MIPPALIKIFAADSQLVQDFLRDRDLEASRTLILYQLASNHERHELQVLQAHPNRRDRRAGADATASRRECRGNGEVERASKGPNVDTDLIRIHVNWLWHLARLPETSEAYRSTLPCRKAPPLTQIYCHVYCHAGGR